MKTKTLERTAQKLYREVNSNLRVVVTDNAKRLNAEKTSLLSTQLYLNKNGLDEFQLHKHCHVAALLKLAIKPT